MHIDAETIDLLALQRRGTDDERRRVAERMFAVWRPLFEHLAGKDAGFHRAAHVEDRSAAYLRAHFYRVDGRDRGLVIARVHAHTLVGRRFSRISLNAGAHHELRGSNVVGWPFVCAIVWAVTRAPKPLFFIDAVGSAAAWRSTQKAFPELRPSPEGEIPEAWWPYAQVAAEGLRCAPVEGRPRGVVRSHIVVAESAAPSGRAESDAAERSRAWHRGFVREGETLLVIFPLTPWRGLVAIVAWLGRVLRRAVLGVPV